MGRRLLPPLAYAKVRSRRIDTLKETFPGGSWRMTRLIDCHESLAQTNLLTWADCIGRRSGWADEVKGEQSECNAAERIQPDRESCT